MFDRQAALLALAKADGQDWTAEAMDLQVAEMMYGNVCDVVHQYMANVDEVMNLITSAYASGVVQGRSEAGLVGSKRDGRHQFAAVKHSYENSFEALRLRTILLADGKYRLPYPEEGKKR